MNELSTEASQPQSIEKTAPARNPWSTARDLLLLTCVASVGVASISLWGSSVIDLHRLFYGALMAALLVLNLGPAIAEFACKRFDPFDAKYLFLGYFFIILTLPCIYRNVFGLTISQAFVVPSADPTLRVRALAVIVLGLASFVAGCYLPLGKIFARFAPETTTYSTWRVTLVALLGYALGLAAFSFLMITSGGIASFLSNLGSWRTIGVAGSGYLTFPIAFVLPGSGLLLMLAFLPPKRRRHNWPSLFTQIACAASLVPLFILGFRSLMVPALLQLFAAWHYARKPFRLRLLIGLSLFLPALLVSYGKIRAGLAGPAKVAVDSSNLTLLYRIPGQDTVERVIWQLDKGEPHYGYQRGLKEAATIIIPRPLWQGKPEPASFAFADIFFYDFFLDRGDPLEGGRSGISPTIIGESLWVGGLSGVVLAGILLGSFATALATWRRQGHGSRLYIFIYVTFATRFPMFVEAPQNALNSFSMLLLFAGGVWLLLSIKPLRVRFGKTSRA